MWKSLNKLIEEAGNTPASKPQAPAKPPMNQRAVDQAFERAITLLQADNKSGAEATMAEVVDRAAATFNSAGHVYADALFKLSLILSTIGEVERAARACRRAVDVPTGDEVARKARLNYQLNLGELLTRLRRFDEAEPVLTENLAARKVAYGEIHAGYAAALSSTADLELARGNPKAALDSANQAVDILAKAAPERLPADLSLRAYAIKSALGPEAAAFEHFAELPRESKAALVRAAIARTGQSDPQIAEVVLIELRDRVLADAKPDGSQQLSVQIALSQVAKATGNHDLRIDAARQAVSLCANLPERSALAAAQRNLAQALSDAGRNAEVPTAYDAAVDAARESGQLPLLSDVLRTYALWADGAGNPATAEPLYEEAAHHGASSGDWSTHGRSSTAFGVFLMHQSRKGDAKRWLEEALAHLPPNHPDIFIARDHLDALNRGEACACKGGTP